MERRRIRLDDFDEKSREELTAILREKERRSILAEGTQQELPLANPPLTRRRLAEEDVEGAFLKQVAEIYHPTQGDPPKVYTGLVEVERKKHLPLAGGFISKADAADVNAHQDAIRAHAIREYSMAVDVVAFLCDGYTDWSRQRPPSSGYWEVKQRSAAAPDPHNWWYAAPINKWHRGVPQKDSRDAGFVEHATLMSLHEWRGVHKPFPGGYSYTLERPAFAADFTPAPDTQSVEVVGKLDVTQRAEVLPDRNPARRRVQL